MKRYLLITIVFLFSISTFSQTVEEGKKFVYYERWESAQKTFEQLIAQQPDNMDAYYWMMQVLLEQNKTAEAKQMLAAAIAKNASHQNKS